MLAVIARAPGAVVGWTGRRVIRSLLYAVDLTVFIMKGFGGFFRQSKGGRAALQPMVNQVIFTGLDALPVIAMLGLIVGFVLTTLLIPWFQLVDQDESVRMLADLVGLEFSSLITAIIIIGRSGTSLAVFMGNMRLGQEVQSLEHLGFDIDHFLVAPPLFAVALSQLVLATYFAAFALFGGVALSALLVDISYMQHLKTLVSAFDPWSVLAFIFKNLIFGLIIAGAACQHGLRVGASPTELPQQVQRAIVGSLILIFIVDAAFALTLR